MQWTMPHRVLQIVASLIVLAAVSAFVMGIIGAPQRGGRLPGEKVAGATGAAAAIDAQDATPLSNERIEGPPPAANDSAKDDDKQTEADAGNSDDESAGAAPAQAAAPPLIKTPSAKPTAAAGGNTPEQTIGGPPAADEPPH